ncbi:Hypothetical predicted protein [Podarcis lilfordi]|uniref:Uncharacterized protein n=1 Tax=Podarcis lilfordi TaxID=74358 RepID=A0AA35JXR0_9SAUR|nr:Hypothetical predicted protein [Podarcis lilfordi]
MGKWHEQIELCPTNQQRGCVLKKNGVFDFSELLLLLFQRAHTESAQIDFRSIANGSRRDRKGTAPPTLEVPSGR